MSVLNRNNKPEPEGYVSPKVARLREVSGHNGPWTSAEYHAAIGTIEPDSEPDPEPPAEVAEAAEQADLARAEFEAAHQAWSEARWKVAQLQRSEGPVRITRDGQLVTDPDTPRKVRKAEKRAEELWEARRLAGEALKRVRVKHQQLESAWRYQLRADAYESNRTR